MSNSQNQSQRVEPQNGQDDNRKLAYDKAIEGYQFQVNRYNIWMNYYAIFVGALFVALYSIWPNTSDGCGYCKCCNCNESTSNIDTWFLLFIISAIGFCASLCWYGALLGYRKWNGHWIKIVQRCESDLVKPGNNILNVYGKMPDHSSKRCIWIRFSNAIKKFFASKDSAHYVAGYVSTQKMTGIFIIGVMASWIVVFAFAIYRFSNNCWCVGGWALGIGVVIAIGSLLCLHHHCSGIYSSRI